MKKPKELKTLAEMFFGAALAEAVTAHVNEFEFVEQTERDAIDEFDRMTDAGYKFNFLTERYER